MDTEPKAPTTALAAAPTFQIEAIYSNADGAVQYVVLREAAGLNGQQAFTGHTLTVTRAVTAAGRSANGDP